MKKIFIIAIVAMLFCVMIIPTSANGNNKYDIDYSNMPHVIRSPDGSQTATIQDGLSMNIAFFSSYTLNGVDYIHSLQMIPINDIAVDGEYLYVYNDTTRIVYVLNEEKTEWQYNNVHEMKQGTTDFIVSNIHYSFSTLYYKDSNEVAVEPDVQIVNNSCDGTSCPATDANYDNICDDCGKPLTMSLRNTLYDYALWLAESKVTDGYNYYAIFKSSDTYYVHISKAPMTSPDGKSLEGDGIMYNRVTQSSDGINGGSGWYNGFYNSYDEFVEANHTISNFKGALPLAVKILGVAGEQITLKLPNLVGILMILMVCGVGCLALLVVLKLFGKRSLIYRK